MKHTHIIVHHTGAEEKDAEQVKRYHLSLGWRDIGYNYVIERDGSVVEGRSLDIPGAHCRAGGMNHCSIGVAVIGNMDEHPLLPEQQEALIKLLGKLMKGHLIPAKNILGHGEVSEASTVCPGRFVDMNKLRRKLDFTVDKTEDKVQLHDLWRVQVGAFSSRERAESYIQQLHRQGFDAFVTKVDIKK